MLQELIIISIFILITLNLEYLIQKYNYRDLFKEGFRDMLVTGKEFFTINEINKIKPKKIINCNINKNRKIKLLCRIDTEKELEYYKSGGILKYLLNQIIDNNS